MVHGGAGNAEDKANRPLYRKELLNALSAGISALKGGSALDAVEASVRCMEDSGVFNAGAGSVLTRDGKMQLDAAIMSGRGLGAGAVGACMCTHNPILLARYLMEHSEHILIVGRDCRTIAIEAGVRIEDLAPMNEVIAAYRKLKSEKGLSGKTGTVGAVAIDRSGEVASAVSTGGTWMKQPGRVGDSAIIGAGIYADPRGGAASATGIGEEIMRNALSWEACRLMNRSSANSAARRAVEALTRRSGRGIAGVITVDRSGGVGSAYNTRIMRRAWYDSARGEMVVRL